MRPVVLLGLLLAGLAGPASAQEQEKKLIDRIMRPDTTLQAREQTRSFQGGTGAVRGRTAPLKAFRVPAKMHPGKYRTRDFAGAKTHWAGDFQFETTPADTRPRFPTLLSLVRRHDTRTVPTREAADAHRAQATREFDTREFRGRGTAQGALDREQEKGKGMSIDQVRELLNKNQ